MPKNKKIDVFKHIDMTGGEDACWPWKGQTNSQNRPYFRVGGKLVVAYRLVYELVHGVELTTDQLVRHKCDNGLCCNPKHLELGSHQENMDDMKDRERHGLSKNAVIAIKRLIQKKTKTVDIAERFGVSVSTIYKIRNGSIYSHVTIPEKKPAAGSEKKGKKDG